jgi:hypothetical protein
VCFPITIQNVAVSIVPTEACCPLGRLMVGDRVLGRISQGRALCKSLQKLRMATLEVKRGEVAKRPAVQSIRRVVPAKKG